MSDSAEITPLGTHLPAGWRLELLGPMCSKIGSGATPRGGSAVYVGSGTSFIRSQNVFDHFFSKAGLAFISEEDARKLSGVTVQPGDVLLNITGDGETIARCCVVPTDVLPARVNQHVVIIRTRPGLEPQYLQRYLSHPRIRQYMLSHNSGGSRRAITKGHVEGFKVVVPPPPEQRAIAAVLGALDDKISCNSRRVRLADELWFAEFSRVLNGWDTAIDSHLPAGWSRVPLSSLARFVNGRNFTKDATGTGRMVVRIAELNSGPGGATVYSDIDVHDDHIARSGDLLFAWSGSLTVKRWHLQEAIVNQHIFKVIPNSATPPWIVHGYLLRLLPWFRQIAADKATTMGHIQRRHLDERVVVPDTTTLHKLNSRCAPVWNSSLAAQRESLVLADLRNTLLPRLLSGELRVRKAEELVEAV